MKSEQVEQVARWLDSLGIRHVVVGGSAIEHPVPVGTGDVNVLVAVGDWEAIDRALENRADAIPLEPYTGTIRSTKLHLGTETVDLEFISGQPFSGNLAGDDFLDYVRTYRATKTRGVRYATPPVVWYMRLSVDDQWQQYVWKINRDIKAGVPASTLESVMEIADHFGVGPRIRERIEFTRKTLRLYEAPRRVPE
ncbi:MAG: hypothetical protein ABSA15_01995 [Thermoplasmata archaeon]